jgi:hypothetical protein
MKFLATDNPRKIIVLSQGLLSEEQMSSALRVSEQTMWWRALVQLIETSRNEFAASAPQQAGANNALALARDAGAYEALSGLLIDLEERRSSEG